LLIFIKSKPFIAREGRKAIESVISKYIGTIEKHGTDTKIFRFKANLLNQSSIDPFNFLLRKYCTKFLPRE
jgi:hypothetical protein